MASGLIPGTPVGQLFSRSSQPSTPTLQDIQENNLGGVSSGHAMSQLHPENSHDSRLGCERSWVQFPEQPFAPFMALWQQRVQDVRVFLLPAARPTTEGPSACSAPSPSMPAYQFSLTRHNAYTWPGSNWRPSACEADVIATISGPSS